MFDSLQDRLQSAFKNLRGKGRLSEADIDATAREIRLALLDADVAVPVVRAFIGRIKERAGGEEVSGALNPAQQVIKIVNEELIGILGGETRRVRFAKNPPTVIMLAGLQGAGKTTLAGKLAHWLKQEGNSPMLVAADLQRPNAVNQLQVVGERAGVTVFAPEPGNTSESTDGEAEGTVGDPVAVARDAVAEARRSLHDVVIVDTAGRLGIDAELMKQASDIRDAVNPDEVLFVLDAMIGQDAVQVAQAFAEGVDFTGAVLTKLDGDARGGAALSIREVTGRPIMFASTGEGLTDFEVFHPDRMASRILDMGDMLTLIEQAEKVYDAERAEQDAARLMGGQFTLSDFLQQMEAMAKMGSMSKLMGMLPGMGQYKEQLANFDEREIDRIKAIIRSMTPAERDNPKIIDGSRRKRISGGSGTTVQDVNQLLSRFADASKMMQQMAKGGGMPGMPGAGGMPGMPGGPGKRAAARQKPQPKKKKGRKGSGNPAKRAQQEREAAKAREAKQAGGAGAFGFDDKNDDFELPKELKDLL
ncbi:signal recognition particle protein [Aeromicrobium sp. CTD01-1L150]|uniref:signal recognition particle protein n=1 Tax=Aeromicrobium sp. CTD01-1L150 TaxID=3341830 RepID=UPI0035C08768